MLNLAQQQKEVLHWMHETFKDEPQAIYDVRERALRFIEEAIELCQALGITQDELSRLQTYVYARPPGDAAQETSGVLITFLALCTAAEIDPTIAYFQEMLRIKQPEVMQRIRDRQVEKRQVTDEP